MKEEIFSELAEKRGSSLFLGKYSLNAVLAVLKKRNFLKEAKKKGRTPGVIDHLNPRFSEQSPR